MMHFQLETGRTHQIRTLPMAIPSSETLFMVLVVL